MSEDKAPVADDATIVHDEAAEEQAHDELVKNVAKMLGQPDEQSEQPADDAETQVGEDSAESEQKPEEQKPEPLSQDLAKRAEQSGLSKELAQRLHETGHLEETLAAFDRTLIERAQPKEPSKPKAEEERQEPQEEEEVPDLDPDVYDEAIVKRDAYHKRRLDALEAQIAELVGERQANFDHWFDGVLTEMGYDTKDEEKCQKTFRAYVGICEASGIAPESRDQGMVERAHAAMFPEDVVKKTQRQTVDRLRDAEGKFISSPKPKGAPPSKGATDEEIHDQLVSNVSSYLKEQGVQMSGY